MTHRTWAFGLLSFVAALVLWPRPDAPRAAEAERIPAPQRMPAFRGAGSCSAAACHGSTGPTNDVRCAYSNWMEKDRHVHAYAALLTERSRTIERNYHAGEAKVPKPEEDRLCLRCHSTNADAVLRGDAVASTDGVSCERCHGPAEKWLSLHYRADWGRLPNREKEALGFVPTKELKRRALLCTECHVGSGEAQVDHDLYAAGHPRLNFELGSYLATMPPHWNVRAEKTRYPDLEARLWEVGQLASAEAALDLLAHRAGKDSRGPWPEFAEYNCFACHHDLKPDAAGQPRGFGGRVPGSLPWGDWYFGMLRPREGKPSPLAGAEAGKLLDALAREMGRPEPRREEVARLAHAASGVLNQRLTAIDRAPPRDVAEVRRQFESFWNEQPKWAGDWDRAASGYLALAALHHTLSDMDPERRDPATVARLKAVAAKLRFPPGFDSPASVLPPATKGPQK